ADDVLIVMAQEALARLFDRLLASFRDVPGEQHAPLLSVDGLAVLLGGALREAPLRRQRVESFLGQRTDRNDAATVLAGERHARRADLRGDRERHLLLQRQEL